MTQTLSSAETAQSAAGAPLAGLRVIDFSRQIAGPYAAMLLGDLGADVIKIEQPGRGDDSRRLAPSREGMSSVFVSANRNKRSVELDLKSSAGIQAARDLIAGADVLVENFSHGVMDRMGLGYDALATDQPRLVYCSITAFGQAGAFAGRPGFDPVTQADCGLFSLNGYPDRPPVRVAAPVVDVASGLTAMIAIQSALLARHLTGRGQRVETALFDVGIALTSYFPMTYLMTGVDHVRTGNASVVGSPSGLYSATDGDFFMSCSTDRMFVLLATEILGRPDLATAAEFHTNAVRCDNNDQLTAVLAPLFAARKRNYWIEQLLAVGIPAGSVRSIGEAVRSPEALDRGLFSQVDHPMLGALPNIAPPFRLEGTPTVSPRAAPQLGEHTRQILCDEFGYSAAQAQAAMGQR